MTKRFLVTHIGDEEVILCDAVVAGEVFPIIVADAMGF